MKKTFVSAAQLEQIAAQYPTPFHIYDEQGIRENARRLNAAFSWNPGFREYFAVKATPTPAIMKVLQEEGCGCDCSSLTELMMAERIGCVGEHIVFSSNETPAEEITGWRQSWVQSSIWTISHTWTFWNARSAMSRRRSAAASTPAARSRSVKHVKAFRSWTIPAMPSTA